MTSRKKAQTNTASEWDLPLSDDFVQRCVNILDQAPNRREELGMSQTQFYRPLGIGQARASRYEIGNTLGKNTPAAILYLLMELDWVEEQQLLRLVEAIEAGRANGMVKKKPGRPGKRGG